MMRMKHRILVCIALVTTTASYGSDQCTRATQKLLSSRPSNAEWSASSKLLSQSEAARLTAIQSINPVSITLERLSTGTHYRIVTSASEAPVMAYSYDGAIDYVSKFVNEAAVAGSVLINLHRFPDQESIAVRQTLRIHIPKDSAYFLEAGPNLNVERIATIAKLQPLSGKSEISTRILNGEEAMISVRMPLSGSDAVLGINAKIRLKSALDRLGEILARLVDRIAALIRALPPSATAETIALEISRELERELDAIAKKSGVQRKDIAVQLAVEGGDIYISLPELPSINSVYYASLNTGDQCSVR